MKFVIQYNLIQEEQLQKIKKAVAKYPHEYVGVIPFSHEITSDEGLEGEDYIPYGSTTMVNIADERKWKGVYFDINKFNYQASLDNRDDMLNSGIYTIKEAMEFLKTQPEDKVWFTRPSNDLKQYSGRVAETKVILDYFTKALIGDSSEGAMLSPETVIVLCEPQNIDAEYRWFVVGGKVVTGSYYRHSGQMYKQRVTDEKQIAEAQTFADKWLPHENCVMDLALVGDEVKVIEFNSINGSGLYDNDAEAIFDALWENANQLEAKHED